MNKNVFDVLRMLRDMDGLQVERHPLPDHYAVRCDNHCRELYATMLAAMLLSSGEVSDNESRLYKLLLNSLKLGDNQAKFFELAQSINKDKLREFLRVVDEHKLAQSFFMDALVLCRLDAPMTDARSRLLSQWVDLLKLDEQQTVTLSGFAANVLGLPTTASMDINFEHDFIQVWKEWYFKELTLDDLKNGLQSNHWILRETINANFAITMTNVRIKFFEGAKLNVFGENEFSIANSVLEWPEIKLSGLNKAVIKNTLVRGNYSQKNKSTAVVLEQVRLANFSNLTVNTQHAQSFFLNGSLAHFSNCSFTECGRADTYGGAISNDGTLIVDNCNFIRCKAKLAGAIYFSGSSFGAALGSFFGSLYGGSQKNDAPVSSIQNSLFEDCLSLAFQDVNKPNDWNKYPDNGGAIFGGENRSYFIEKCRFIRANINLGWLNEKRVCNKCYFEDSYAYFKDGSSSHSDQIYKYETTRKRLRDGGVYGSSSHNDYPSMDEPWI